MTYALAVGALVSSVACEPTTQATNAVVAASPTTSPAPRPSHSPSPAKHIRPARRVAAPRLDARSIELRPPYDLTRTRVALSCGYHASCKRRTFDPLYAPGDGLDWNDNNGTIPETKTVFFTAAAHASVKATIARVTFIYHLSMRDRGYPCATLVAKVSSVPDGRPLFSVKFEHVAPLSSLKPFDIVGLPAPLAGNRPNVIHPIARMIEDGCPYFTPHQFHVHVAPDARARYVGFTRNTTTRSGARVIPDVNGCSAACAGPVYPGIRWPAPYWTVWTHRWDWTFDTRTHRVRT